MEKLIIDTDPGVDDALAIMLAIKSRKFDIAALTTVSGNVNIDHVTENACTLLELCEAVDIPVYRGSKKPLEVEEAFAPCVHGEDGLGNVGYKPLYKKEEKEEAVDFLVSYVEAHKKEVTLVLIGPLTNIARAVEKDSKFAENVKRVVIMGGAEFGGNMTPEAEFNFYHDPEAARIVFEAGFPDMVMVGLDATKKIMLTPALRELIHQIRSKESEFIYQITEGYVTNQWEWSKLLSCELCDVLTIGYLLEEAVMKTVPAHVVIETAGLCRGCSVVYRTDIFQDKKENCRVAVDADGKEFFKLFFHTMFPAYDCYSMPLIESEYR